MTNPAQRLLFNQPYLEGRELEYIRAAVEAGHTSSSGPFAKRCSELLGAAMGAPDVLLTTSCTDALEMAAMMLDLTPDDTVIVPSFTFVSTALAFARAGARLLFCDIEPRTLGLDPHHLAELMDDSVRAVVPVHYAGVAVDVEGMNAVLREYPAVDVIEDNAHGLFATYRDQPLGSLGRFSTLSFHETKNFTCGEGGALVINRASDVDRAHVLYDKGTNRRAFMLGQVDKYSWQDLGSSFGLGELLAAYLYAQLEQRNKILSLRRRVFERYQSLLEPHRDEFGFQLPFVPADREQGYHMFYVLLRTRGERDRALAAMHAQNITATFHYVPLHSAEGAKPFMARWTDCPVTDDISGRLLRLPFYNHLGDQDAQRVVDTLLWSLGS